MSKYDYSSTLASGGALSEERIVGPAIDYYYYYSSQRLWSQRLLTAILSLIGTANAKAKARSLIICCLFQRQHTAIPIIILLDDMVT